jgi:methionyl-tRNA formyltransferase
MTRVAFLGTPGAAVPTLRALAEHHEVALVITRPDRPRGRSGSPLPPPVKEVAMELGLRVSQPEGRAGIAAELASIEGLDVGVVVAYGQILDRGALGVPRHGMLNLHFSLLPRWRGAAPVARALLAGDPMTGVTIIRLDEGLDTGPVLTAQAVDIGPEETAGELTERLAVVGAGLLLEVMPGFVDGETIPVTQSESGMTYAGKLEPGERPLEVSGAALDAVRRIRALSPEPGATLVIDLVPHQVLRARLHPSPVPPGTWAEFDGRPAVGFADGAVELVEVQPPGKRLMTGAAWLAGRRQRSGLVA